MNRLVCLGLGAALGFAGACRRKEPPPAPGDPPIVIPRLGPAATPGASSDPVAPPLPELPVPRQPGIADELVIQRSEEVQRQLAKHAVDADAALEKVAEEMRRVPAAPERPMDAPRREALRQAAFTLRRAALDNNPQGLRTALDEIGAMMRTQSLEQAEITRQYVNALLTMKLGAGYPVWSDQGIVFNRQPPPPVDEPATPAP